MSYNVFVSYKYADTDVQHLTGHFPTKVRHYVDDDRKVAVFRRPYILW